MGVSRIQAGKNRETAIDVASRLFREHGFDGIGRLLPKQARKPRGRLHAHGRSTCPLASSKR